jgi:hypothetical protein
MDIMKTYTLLSVEIIGISFLANIPIWGSEAVIPRPSKKIARKFQMLSALALEDAEQRSNRGVLVNTEKCFGLQANEFRQLPLAFRRRIKSLQGSCNLYAMKKITEFLREFLQTMPPYKHYAAERIFFKAIRFIVQHSDIRYNRKICELLSAIENEFQEVGEFIAPRPRYPLFSEVMPWHDDPLGDCIDRGDSDGLKEVLSRCLTPDFIHNVLSGDTGGLFKIYRQAAQSQGVWDDEIDGMFRELEEKYPHQSKLCGLSQDFEAELCEF